MKSPAPWLDPRTAPNGRPVRENFADWFGRSRVRTALGAPAVTYHATRLDFDAFDRSRLGLAVRNPTTRLGFYFSSEPAQVERWLHTRGPGLALTSGPGAWPGEGGRVLPVYLAIEHPMVLDHARFRYLLSKARAATIDKLLAKAVAHGHDGFQIEYRRVDADGREANENATWWVPLQGWQIKSAIGNSGCYDRSSDSLTETPAIQASPGQDHGHRAGPQESATGVDSDVAWDRPGIERMRF